MSAPDDCRWCGAPVDWDSGATCFCADVAARAGRAGYLRGLRRALAEARRVDWGAAASIHVVDRLRALYARTVRPRRK